jgi:AcrR family transcriptional regulator
MPEPHGGDTAPRPPRPLLSARAEAKLGPRHRAVLDQLEELFLSQGFATFTVRDLASSLRCSLRTLYEIAPSKQELVLVVVDRFLHRVGRTALGAIDATAPVADQIREYFLAGVELQRQTVAFAEDAADEPAMLRLLDNHYRYVTAVVEGLVAEGIRRGEMKAVDPRIAAAVFTGAGEFLTRPAAGVLVDQPLAEVVSTAVDVVLNGLAIDDVG